MQANHRRLGSDEKQSRLQKSSPLPLDYLKLVADLFTGNFEAGLKAFGNLKRNPRFEAHGAVFTNEVLLCISLVSEGNLAATSIFASTDFDPKASSPTVEDLLSACVDAIGSGFETMFDPKHPEQLSQLAAESLAALDDAPFDWTKTEANRIAVYVRVDKSNPALEKMADEWLAKHDPNALRQTIEEEEETKGLFVTGPKAGTPKPQSDN